MEKKLVEARLDIRDKSLKRNQTESPEPGSSKKKQRKNAMSSIDLTGDRELEFIEEEARDHRETDKKTSRNWRA